MTKLLEQAVAAVSSLPHSAQDEVASLILEEVASEKRWADSFAKSGDKLATLADEAIEEFKRGETESSDNLLE